MNRTFLTTVVAVLFALSATAGASITIGNAGFEDPVRSDGAYTVGNVGVWGHIGNADTVGVWNPDATGAVFYGYGGVAPEGQNVGYVQGSNGDPEYPGGFAQVLAETLTTDTQYELTVQVGNNFYYSGGMYAIELLAGGSLADNGGQITAGTVLAAITGAADDIAEDTFELKTLTFDSTGVDAGLLGQNLQIRLYVTEGGEVDFDNVQLDDEDDPTAPDVDAGEDMITWSEEPVKMDPNVVNNDVTPLTYLWTAATATGVVFDPSADVEDPTVTITKPASITTAISIVNPGFETPVLADGAYTLDFTTCPGWSDVDAQTAGGVWNPGLPGTAFPGYGGNSPEGQNIAYVNKSGIKQVLTKTLTADTTYTLTVKVGNTDGFPWTGYKVQLLSGETVLAEDDNTVAIATGTFGTSTVTYTYDSGDSALLGQALQIRLLCLGANGEADFDDVQLTVEAPAPDPYVVTLTLAVNNEGKPAVTDTMKIDVYDDACEAARIGKGLAADNPGDFNENCITDANDLAELAAKWLTGDALTAPITKP
jgi:hypothetical protein